MMSVKKWAKHKSQYNPLRGLTIPRAVTLLEQHERGEYADVQWAFRFCERRYPVLMALVKRRTSAILEMEINIKAMQVNPGDARTLALAEQQVIVLREAYDRIDNLYEAIHHLCLASFREFAHVEKHRNAYGEVTHLEVLDQWNVVRCMSSGRWKYNPDALNVNYAALPDTSILDMRNFIYREEPLPIDPIALLAFIRSNMSQKDWDSFVETYGIPPLFVIMPPGISEDKQKEYQAIAEEVAGDARGALPGGSDVKTVDIGARAHPFKEHKDDQRAEVVLAGTGGLLTMLTESGSGTLAGSAHEETFRKIAAGEARLISEAFQKHFDAEVLERAFPGAPRLAYFDLSAGDATTTDDVIEQAKMLKEAGYTIEKQQLEEKTGYRLEICAMPDTPGREPDGVTRNRATPAPYNPRLVADGIKEIAEAQRAALRPVAEALQGLYRAAESDEVSDAVLTEELESFRAMLPHYIDPSSEIVTAIEELFVAAWANGIEEAANERG